MALTAKLHQHKLVSEALDIGQLMYSMRKYANKLKLADYNIADRVKAGVWGKQKLLTKRFPGRFQLS